MQTDKNYVPPYTITTSAIHLVEQIGECLGRMEASGGHNDHIPMLPRNNRIKTIQSSLGIEGNTLSVEQVTAILDGKRVLGKQHEIQEVRNAYLAYDKLDRWNPSSSDDLLGAHFLLMKYLLDSPGKFRTGSVGIKRGENVVHVAPPAERVGLLVGNLLAWLSQSTEHPLIASCVFHYELEFIHPFEDGNGRLGRLWQTLILSRWKLLFAFLPVETMIHTHQGEYYKVLRQADGHGDSTVFIEFMLKVILGACEEAIHPSDQVGDQVTDQVKRVLLVLQTGPYSAVSLMENVGLSHRPNFRKNYLHPALQAELIEFTIPDKPKSKAQQYKLTALGKSFLVNLKQ